MAQARSRRFLILEPGPQKIPPSRGVAGKRGHDLTTQGLTPSEDETGPKTSQNLNGFDLGF